MIIYGRSYATERGALVTGASLMTTTDIDFSSLVRRIRDARGITQEQLARELEVTFSTVNGWENGKHQPIPSLARRLLDMAEASGVRSPESVPGNRSRPRRKRRRKG
jgi:transcriptional regulator with XRE-family HTH domain